MEDNFSTGWGAGNGFGVIQTHYIYCALCFCWGFPLPAMQETQVRSLGQEGNGYPFQCSCLENSMDRGAWQATVHGLAELDTAEPIVNCGVGEDS